MSQCVSICPFWHCLTQVSKNQVHFYKNTQSCCPYLCVSQNIRMCVCMCIIPTLLFLMAQKVTLVFAFGFLPQNSGSWQGLLMVVCCVITGLFTVCSSVELVMVESLNSTVLFTNNISNVSELYGNITNVSISEEHVDNNLLEISRLMHVYGRPPIIIFGTLGNILAFIVMRRGLMRHVSTCFYMAILALANIGQ